MALNLDIVILAAGQGKRMLSKTPKVLHNLAGKPMIQHVIETARTLEPRAIHIIIGHGGEKVKETIADPDLNWVVQEEQLGTGHAVRQVLPHLEPTSHLLVLSADVPLIQEHTLQRLISSCDFTTQTPAELGLLVANVDNPSGLGRIVRDSTGNIIEVVEEKDADEAQKAIQEIYSGICIASVSALNRWLPALNNQNAQGEFYLTEIISMAVREKAKITSISAETMTEILGANTRSQLQTLERAFQLRQAEQLMLQGVTLADANRIDIRGNLMCEPDVYIDVNNVFEGAVRLDEGSHIGPNCCLKNVIVEKGCMIAANSVLEDCRIGAYSQVGPFARLRPGTVLAEYCKIGNFVETKKARLDTGSKASHLSYLGDVTIGKNVNIGAGTITCNYDGVNKHQTTIEDGVFIGSDTQLVAPVTVGKNATIGAGSTIRKNVPPEELTITESKQKTIHGWKRPEKV